MESSQEPTGAFTIYAKHNRKAFPLSQNSVLCDIVFFFKFIGWLDTLILPYVIVCFVYLHPPRFKKNNNMT